MTRFLSYFALSLVLGIILMAVFAILRVKLGPEYENDVSFWLGTITGIINYTIIIRGMRLI